MYGPGFVIVLLVVIIILFSVKILKDVRNRNKYQKFPPGPRPLPFIGNLLLMDLKRPHKTFIELSKTYGSVFSIQLGMKTMVVLSGYETVKDALVNYADEFAERAVVPVFEEINKGFGIPFAHGENWKVMRRFTIATLRDFGMGKRTIEDKIIEESDFLIKHFESHEGRPFSVTVIMNAAVANIITNIILGQRFHYDHPTLLKLTSLVNENVQLLGSPTVNLFNLFPSIVEMFPGNHKIIRKNINDIHAFLRKFFLKSRQELNRDDQRNYIDAFLVKEQEEKTNPNSFFHDVNLITAVTALFTAGTDTTSSTLRWSLLLMLKYEDIQKKVQEEIEKVIGSSQPKAEHRKQMPYTDAVVHEIQRYSNILPMSLPRETTVDTHFRGYFIPKGTHIIPLLESVLKDTTQFETPEEFNPQHFLDAHGKFVKKHALLPFGAGRRICLGETLAKMELFLFFTSLLQKFTLRLPPGVTNVDLTPAVGLTTPPMPYQLCALARF